MAGYFDPATRRLTWAQAGHPPPVLVRGRGRAAARAAAGDPAGRGQGGYQDARLDLLPGDLLLLYSDGLIERRDRPLDEGLATLCAAVRGVGDPGRAIAAALRAWRRPIPRTTPAWSRSGSCSRGPP